MSTNYNEEATRTAATDDTSHQSDIMHQRPAEDQQLIEFTDFVLRANKRP